MAQKTDTNNDDLSFPGSSEDKDMVETIYTQNDIRKRCIELGNEISKHYSNLNDNNELVVVGLLRGAFVFLADLVRCITIPHKVDFLMLSSYSGTESTNVKITKDLTIDPYNKHILIVEDLIDTGATLEWLSGHLKSKKCASVKLCCLLDKQTQRRKVNLNIDYVGYKCEDKWIVGYGMDYNQYYRSLPYVGVLNPNIYQKDLEKKSDQKKDE